MFRYMLDRCYMETLTKEDVDGFTALMMRLEDQDILLGALVKKMIKKKT